MAQLPVESVRHIERHGRMQFSVDPAMLTGDEAVVIIVLHGAVKAFRSYSDGKQALMHISGRGDVVNAEALVTGYDIPHTTLAVGDSSLVFTMDRRRFGQLVARDEDIRRALMHSFARRVQEHDMWRGHVGRTVEAQVWAFLVSLARRHGIPVLDETRLDIGLTQQEIASALGVSCSSVETAVRNLREAGRLRTGYAFVELLCVPSEEELDRDC